MTKPFTRKTFRAFTRETEEIIRTWHDKKDWEKIKKWAAIVEFYSYRGVKCFLTKREKKVILVTISERKMIQYFKNYREASRIY